MKSWKESKCRKPLVLQGAHPVGKTYAVLQFGKGEYDNVAYFNFQTSEALAATFDEDISPAHLLPILSHISGQTITKGRTLIVFDEVQLCEWLGHSDISTTMNIYAHLDTTAKDVSAAAMSQALSLPDWGGGYGWKRVE